MFKIDMNNCYFSVFNQSKLSSSFLNIKNISNKEKSGVILVFSDGCEKELDALSIVGQNTPRVVKGKMPYDVVFFNMKAYREYKENLERFKKISISTTSFERDNLLSAAIKLVALRQNCAYIDGCDLSRYKKAYIWGHGREGFSSIRCGEKYISKNELVSLLKEHHVTDKIKDFRITSCGSADKRKLKSFDINDIENSKKESGLLERVLIGERKSLAESVADEFWSQSDTDITVTGYHGKGVFAKYDGNEVPDVHLRSIEIPSKTVERRSTLKEVYKCEID
ncbi:hypothetical protein ILY70_004011 [Vibrio mimicus]